MINKSTLFLISGWLAVPYKDYQKLYIDAGFDGITDSEDSFYTVAKYIADEKNDSNDTATVFKNKMKKRYYEPLIDFIQLYYDIRQNYTKTFLIK